jgi:hypothetical protein
MTLKRYIPTLRTFWLGTFLSLHAAGCGESEPGRNAQQTDPSMVRTDGAAPVQGATPVGEAGIEDCIYCPLELRGQCEASNASQFPTYDETRAEWLASCPQPGQRPALPIVNEGRCGAGLRYLQIQRGLGAERRYFDADGNFVSVTQSGDLIDAVCQGQLGWPVRTTCEAEAGRTELCGPSSTP